MFFTFKKIRYSPAECYDLDLQRSPSLACPLMGFRRRLGLGGSRQDVLREGAARLEEVGHWVLTGCIFVSCYALEQHCPQSPYALLGGVITADLLL